jgi:hypothetical protein
MCGIQMETEQKRVYIFHMKHVLCVNSYKMVTVLNCEYYY